MTAGQWILVVAVVLALCFGLWRARTDGRFRAPAVTSHAGGESQVDQVPQGESDAIAQDGAPSVVAGTPFAAELGERATFLQFSSAFCAPCRVTRRTLEEVTDLLPDVAHVEVDAELHLDLVRRLDVLRTPTTLVLDAAGREVTRAAGAPTKQQVLSALALVDRNGSDSASS